MIRPFYYYVFRIKDGLFIGNKRAADDIKFHHFNQITTIINCAATEIKINNPLVNSINFEWLDTEDQIIIVKKDVELVFHTIEETNRKGESVLISCVQGQSRSVTLAAAYLMKKFFWNLKTTLQYLQICRKDFEIRESYLFQLSIYERELMQQLKVEKIQQNVFKEEEILIKNTYYNAKSNEFNILINTFDKIYSLPKRLKKKQQKKVSWSSNLIQIIKTLEQELNQEKNRSIKLSALIANNPLFTQKKKKKLTKLSTSFQRNKTPEPSFENWEMQPRYEQRSISVIPQQKQNKDQFRKDSLRIEKQKRTLQRIFQLKLR